MATEMSRPTDLPGDVLRGIDWTTYVQLRDHPGNNHLRMSYLDGTLILMSPTHFHAFFGRRLAMVIDQFTEALQILVQGTATATLRRKGNGRRKGSAKEPDYGFYFGRNARRMHRRPELDLEVDPPPDLVIEAGSRFDSAKALKLYARLGVPEVWRYRPKANTLWFGRLVGDTYEPIERSLNLPRLTPSLVVSALSMIDEMGETPSKPWLRDWARNLPDPAI
jgi:Uma2 family endonuclease